MGSEKQWVNRSPQMCFACMGNFSAVGCCQLISLSLIFFNDRVTSLVFIVSSRALSVFQFSVSVSSYACSLSVS